MKAGTIALIQYATAILMILLVTWHVAVRIPWLHGVEDLPSTMSPEIIYDEVRTFWPLLILLSIVVVIHGVNGLRGILLEWVVDKRLKLVINALAILAIIALLLVAVHTVVGVPELG